MGDQQREPSPFDALGETLWKIIGDQLHEAVTSSAFAAALRQYGIAVSPACDGAPGPPEEWVNDGLDLVGGGDTEIVDPLGHLDGMWRTAYELGWQGYAARRDDLKAELERAESIKAELRRQLDAQLRQVVRLRWLARYLPSAIRRLALPGRFRPDAEPSDRPPVEWADAVDQRAADAGLVPYPGDQG
jgi:hypothetical protein